jgi:hypothetical protein
MTKVKSKKVLPKAQLGTIVKTIGKYAKPIINATKSAIGYTKPAAKSIIKDTKVVVRPVNRSTKPIAKKLDSKVAEKFIVNKTHAKVHKYNDKIERQAAKIGLGIGGVGAVGTAGLIMNSMNDKKAKVKVKSKKK